MTRMQARSNTGLRKLHADRSTSLRCVTSLAILCAFVVAPLAAQPGSFTFAGRWKMSIAFTDGAHPAGLEIRVDHQQVTGKFVAAFAGGEVPIEGELSAGKLTFSASTTGGPHPGLQLDFSASAKDNDTLTGQLSAPFGDFSWTAERID